MATKSEMEQHQPLITIEGMLKGSLKRLGDFFSDPQNFGSMTHDVLKGTGGRYQEALDKCEIQILNAKWILEHELAQARAKRVPKPVETVNPTKRKLDDTEQAKESDESPAKKQKAEEAKDEYDPLSALDEAVKDMEDGASDNAETAASEAKPAAKTASGPPDSTIPASESAQAGNETSNQESTTESKEPAGADEQPDTATSQHIDFDSMFGDLDDGNNGDNEIDFSDLDNLNAGSDSFDLLISQSENLQNSNTSGGNTATVTGTEVGSGPGAGTGTGTGGDQSSISNLPNMDTFENTEMTNEQTTNPDINKNLPTDAQPDLTDTSNVFDLPEIGEDTTTFDELFGDMEMGGHGSGSKDDDLLNDDSMLELGTFDDNWLMDG